jgi:hypothetical protein
MEMDRKYKQKGYSERDGDRDGKKRERPLEPRPKQDATGPRTPRMVGSVVRARCTNCGVVLLPGFDPDAQCPKCHFEMHCCKQCRHFDTGARFECTEPILERIPKKDAKNNCDFFEFRMTVEKDTSPIGYSNNVTLPVPTGRPGDARQAFEDLFKK